MRISEIGIGRFVKESKSGIIFRIAGQNHYEEGITTLLSENVLGVRAFDAAESNDCAGGYLYEANSRYGNNHYIDSNIHQWLNSSEDDWYSPTHKEDMPPISSNLRYGEFPYDTASGFLSNFSPQFCKALAWTDIPVLTRVGRGALEISKVWASVFLPSRTEMNKGSELGIPEGKVLPIFYDHYIFKAKPSSEQLALYGRAWNPEEPEKNLYFDIPQMYDPKFGWWYWMRTPNALYSFLTRVMSPYGSVSYTYANNDDVGFRPLINLSNDTNVIDIGVESPLYLIV